LSPAAYEPQVLYAFYGAPDQRVVASHWGPLPMSVDDRTVFQAAALIMASRLEGGVDDRDIARAATEIARQDIANALLSREWFS